MIQMIQHPLGDLSHFLFSTQLFPTSYFAGHFQVDSRGNIYNNLLT